MRRWAETRSTRASSSSPPAGIARAIAVANSNRVPAKLGIGKALDHGRLAQPQLRAVQAQRGRPEGRGGGEGGVDRPAADRHPRGRGGRTADRRVVELRRSTRRPSATRTSSSRATTPPSPSGSSRRRSAGGARRRGTPARRPGTVVNVWTNSNEGDISPDGGTDKVRRARDGRARPGRAAAEESLQYSGNSFTQRAHGRDEGRAGHPEGLAQGREVDDGRHAARLAARLRGFRRHGGRRRADRAERRARSRVWIDRRRRHVRALRRLRRPGPGHEDACCSAAQATHSCRAPSP